MRWSKLKKLVEENFADSIKARVAIHSTSYAPCACCGRAWLTLDGVEIANLCSVANAKRFRNLGKEFDRGISEEQKNRYKNQFVEYGEMSRQEVYDACWEFIHKLTFDDALISSNPLIQTLAVLDKRLGKRRYEKVNNSQLHPLARKLFSTRLSCEEVSQPA